jgi:hypothetical protein
MMHNLIARLFGYFTKDHIMATLLDIQNKVDQIAVEVSNVKSVVVTLRAADVVPAGSVVIAQADLDALDQKLTALQAQVADVTA